MTQAQPQESNLERDIHRLRGLVKQQQFSQALEFGQVLLVDAPENRDVLYLVAISQRCQGLIANALQTLAQLEKRHAGFGRLYEELGHCYRAVGQAQAAILAYRNAVALNASLEASWKGLVEACRVLGQKPEAQLAADQLARLARLPPVVVQASDMMAEGDLYNAENALRNFLESTQRGQKLQIGHVEAMRLLAHIGIRLDILDEAEGLLENVLALAPDYHGARYDYVNVLLKRQKDASALEQVQRLLQAEPDNAAYKFVGANVYVGLGRNEEALHIFRQLIAAAPENAQLHLSAAHVLKTLGRQTEAIESYKAAAAARPSFGDAYWGLANLKTYRFGDQEISSMRGLEAAQETLPVDRYHLCFALGKALEDRADYEQSFHYYARGNSFKRDSIRYDPDLIDRLLHRQAQVCTADLFASRQGMGCGRPDPIFIVGLPRAGSTLLEQILASHSQVQATTELADITLLGQRLSGHTLRGATPRYPGVLTQLNAEQLRRLGEKYLADTQVYRTGKPFFIDKMPNNFRHIGLIHLILPNAKIIDMRRGAMACCFGNFKQLFSSGQEFAYSLEDIAQYYRGYVEMMRHWDVVLPGKILHVQYEHLVEDLEGSVRRILQFCDLPFESGCLEFYNTERSIGTASSEQVRQPIFKESLYQWRHYEPWLAPLKEALGELADN